MDFIVCITPVYYRCNDEPLADGADTPCGYTFSDASGFHGITAVAELKRPVEQRSQSQHFLRFHGFTPWPN